MGPNVWQLSREVSHLMKNAKDRDSFQGSGGVGVHPFPTGDSERVKSRQRERFSAEVSGDADGEVNGWIPGSVGNEGLMGLSASA
jgi:hypothetical protein